MMKLTYSWIVFGTMVLAANVSAVGQVHQVQQGRLLDASNRLGSGGLNYARPAYDFNAGNRLMTGNVAGGRGFRGFSPISNPNALFLGSNLLYQESGSGLSSLSSSQLTSILPSDQLSAFRRDSYNLTDYRRQSLGWGVGRTDYLPYYSSSSTVTNTGAIVSGRNRVGTSQVLDPYQTLGNGIQVQPRDPFATSDSLVGGNSSLAVPSRLLRRTTDQPVTGQVNDRLLQSRLFGSAVRELPLTELSSEKRRDEALGASVAVAPVPVTEPVDLRVNPLGPVDTRIAASRLVDRRVEMGSGLDRVLERAAADGDWQAGRTEQVPSTTGVPGGNRAFLGALRGLQSPGAGSLENVGDVFARMREVGGVSGVLPRTRLTSPTPEANVGQGPEVSLVYKFGGAQGVRPTGTGLAGPEPGGVGPATATPGPPPKVPAPDLSGQDALLAPIKTFVGTNESLVNDYLARGEAELQAGNFYQAAEMYRLAQSVAPDNPLPVLGDAMALLAAGDYMSSASSLFAAIQMFESLSLFEVDLKTFVADLDVLDRRRADLEARLEMSENYQLRFLLGWAEYCSGLRELGLSNMEKAMNLAPSLPGAVEQAGNLEEPAAPAESREQPGVVRPKDYRSAELQAVRRFVQSLRQHGERSNGPVDVTPH